MFLLGCKYIYFILFHIFFFAVRHHSYWVVKSITVNHIHVHVRVYKVINIQDIIAFMWQTYWPQSLVPFANFKSKCHCFLIKLLLVYTCILQCLPRERLCILMYNWFILSCRPIWCTSTVGRTTRCSTPPWCQMGRLAAAVWHQAHS